MFAENFIFEYHSKLLWKLAGTLAFEEFKSESNEVRNQIFISNENC